MSVHDAQPNDIYVDEQGKLWRIIDIIGEPSILIEEIEKSGDYPDDEKLQMRGGVSGLMWAGFK